ncbi:MAG: hypothetical protein KGR98_01220 [Verrucomicrobia bacterium]|nr:hypothetical protein [Verrucomicrobiota bacterium]MDE3098200.1 hypothetical protein [Verrucomicrobiota bacterium]
MSETPTACCGTRRARIGKVARAPYAVRTRVNEMLRDGAAARQVIEYLEAQGIKDVSDCNISVWRHGGYQDWLAEQQPPAEQERLAMMARRRDLALEIVKQCQGSRISEAAFHIAASQVYEVLGHFNPARLKALLAAAFFRRPAHTRVTARPPLDIQTVEQSATTAEVKADLDAVRQKIEDLRFDQSRNSGKLHRKINGISRNLYLIAGRLGVKTIPTSDEADD